MVEIVSAKIITIWQEHDEFCEIGYHFPVQRQTTLPEFPPDICKLHDHFLEAIQQF